MRPLRSALNRSETFERELDTADQPTKDHLLNAWKEQVLEDAIEVLQETTDPKRISHVDLAVATVRELNLAKV